MFLLTIRKRRFHDRILVKSKRKKAQRIKKPTFLTQKATKHLKKLPNHGLRPKIASYSSKEIL